MEFPEFWKDAVVHEKNSDTWEFGKGALNELRFCGVAVLQCCSRKNERWKAKVEVERVQAEGEMSNG